MPNNRYDNINYVDFVGHEVLYDLGQREMGIMLTGELFWLFNGRMLIGVV